MKAHFVLLTSFMTIALLACTTAASEARRVISLDGVWEVAEGGMDRRPEQFDHRVPVPGIMDMAEPAFEEVGVKSERRQAFWYRRTFKVEGEIPAVAELKLHKSMYGTRVWLNGKDVGEHAPCFTPAFFNVREQLHGQGRENEIVVRVGATREALPESIPTGHDFEKKFYVPGIYDSVELILTQSPGILRVQAVPDLEAKAVRVRVWLREADGTKPASAITLNCIVREAKSGRQAGAVEHHWAPSSNLPVTTETSAINLVVPISDCRLWSPEDPFLYELELSAKPLQATDPTDMVRTRFGMRSFRFDKASGRAMLNGQPYYLRGTNVCIFRFFEDAAHGDKAWREDWVRKLHRAFRDMHWNSIRYCIGFPPELWYRIADEEGLLIQDEFPIWHGANWPAALKSDELIREYTEWMQERWNHPCVVIWDADNETISEETGKAIRAVRSLDLSNRPWDDGYNAPQAPDDMFECHPYVFINPLFRLGQVAKLPLTHIGNARPNDKGNPMLINEYGWLWLNRDGTPTTLTKAVYENLLGAAATPAERRLLYARYLAALTEYWRAQRRFAGVLHFCGLSYSRQGGQTSDNFVDLDTLTFEPEFRRYVRDAFAPVGVVIDEWADELTAGEEHAFPVVVINDLCEDRKPEVTLRLLQGEQVIFQAAQFCEVAAFGKARLPFKIRLPAEPGNYQLVAEMRLSGDEAVTLDPPQPRPQPEAVKPHGEVKVCSLRDVEVLSLEQQQARRGVAEHKEILASSVVTVNGESFPAENANDGNLATRWSSEFSDPQWIAIDLGSSVTISRIELLWEHAHAKAYQIQVSQDGKTWSEVYKSDTGGGGKEVIRIAPTETRWVRMLGTHRATQFGYSLWEFRVFR